MASTRRFDVAFYVPWLGPLLQPEGGGRAPGGMEAQVLHLARGLAARGYAVCAIVRQVEGGVPRDLDGIRIVPVPAVRGSHDRSELAWEARFGLSLARTLIRTPSDVVVQRGSGIETGIVGAAARACRRRFVFMAANVVDFQRDWESSGRNRRAFELGVRLADAVVVQTDEQVEMCRRRFGREPVLIRSVAEAAEPSEGDPEAYLWVGRLASYKRPEAFIELAEALPDLPFRMVPTTDQLDAGPLRERAAALTNLEWLEPRPRAELLELIGSAAAVVSTSEVEGMPNVFLEAWARGVPTVTLDFDPDGVIEREGLGFAAGGDSSRLAGELRSLWDEPERRQEIAARCVAYVQREHGLDHVLDRLVPTLGLEERAPAGTHGQL